MSGIEMGFLGCVENYDAQEEAARRRRMAEVQLAERGVALSSGKIDWNTLNATSLLTGDQTVDQLIDMSEY